MAKLDYDASHVWRGHPDVSMLPSSHIFKTWNRSGLDTLQRLPKRFKSTNGEVNLETKMNAPRAPLQAPRGMSDVFGLEQRKRQFVVDTCRKVAQVYGFEELVTPLVEEEAVFSRTLGDDSDVVSKEMYVFPDKSGNSLALRPEGTAGVVRAAINHKYQLGSRLFYSGPMFRYERPQKGRSRQVRLYVTMDP